MKEKRRSQGAQESSGELKVKTGSCPRSAEGTEGQQGSKLNFKMVAIKKKLGHHAYVYLGVINYERDRETQEITVFVFFW